MFQGCHLTSQQISSFPKSKKYFVSFSPILREQDNILLEASGIWGLVKTSYSFPHSPHLFPIVLSISLTLSMSTVFYRANSAINKQASPAPDDKPVCSEAVYL